MLSKEELINLVSTNVDAFNTEIRNAKGGIDLSETDFSNIELEGAEFFNVDLTSAKSRLMTAGSKIKSVTVLTDWAKTLSDSEKA